MSKYLSEGIFEYSSKMAVLERFLTDLNKTNEKVVLISYYTQVRINIYFQSHRRRFYSLLDTP